MMIDENADEEDDLPVLTDVLRARAPALREALDPRRARHDEVLRDLPAEAETQDEELVIGTAPEAESELPSIPAQQVANVADAETQAHPHAEGLVGAPHVDPFDEEDEVFLESFDGVATTDDLNAIEGLREEEAVVVAPATAPAAFDSDAMAARVRDAVLDDLAQRIDTELDARLSRSVTAQLESALAGLQSGLRASLSDALRDVVRRAVDDEIARLRDPRNA